MRDRFGDRLEHHGFAGERRRDDKSALAFADRRDQIDDAGGQIFVIVFELDALLGIERGQVVEQDFVARLFGVLVVDRFNLEQREVALALLRRPNQTRYGIAGTQIELSNLAGRDVDVVGTGQIVVIGRAQKAVTIRQDLQHAFGENMAFFFTLRLQNFENKVLFAESACARDLKRSRDTAQLCNVFFLSVRRWSLSPAVGRLFGKVFLTGRNLVVLQGISFILFYFKLFILFYFKLLRPSTAGRGLRCAALLNFCLRFNGLDGRHWIRVTEANHHIVRCILHASVWLVQLTGRLGSQLTQLIAIGNVGQSPKNQIRTHCISPSYKTVPRSFRSKTLAVDRRSSKRSKYRSTFGFASLWKTLSYRRIDLRQRSFFLLISSTFSRFSGSGIVASLHK